MGITAQLYVYNWAYAVFFMLSGTPKTLGLTPYHQYERCKQFSDRLSNTKKKPGKYNNVVIYDRFFSNRYTLYYVQYAIDLIYGRIVVSTKFIVFFSHRGGVYTYDAYVRVVT